jgi:hypothetical protein
MVRSMTRRPLTLLAALAAAASLLAALPALAAAKAPRCTRGGATLITAQGGTAIVGQKLRPRNSETRRTRILACRIPTGRRFTMFDSRDFGLDLIERDGYEILFGGRFIGVIRDFEGGVSESRTAELWSVVQRRRLHDTKPCSEIDRGDLSGIDDAVFWASGIRSAGMAYACDQLRIADGKGDRQVEPATARVRNLAVSQNSFNFGPRLYWTVTAGGTEGVRSLDVN